MKLFYKVWQKGVRGAVIPVYNQGKVTVASNSLQCVCRGWRNTTRGGMPYSTLCIVVHDAIVLCILLLCHLNPLFLQAKMNLHDFETNFFHRQAFYVYFWTFAITYLTTVSVTYFQWRGFIEKVCLIDDANITFQRAFAEPYGVPLRIPVSNDTYTNRTICKMYSDPANITTVNEPFFDKQCWAYYSKFTVYTWQCVVRWELTVQ